jgi:predicted HTH transcriptional regulator
MPSLYRRKCDLWRQAWISKTAKTEVQILEFIKEHPCASSNQIFDQFKDEGKAAIKKILADLGKAEVIRFDYKKRGYFLR